MSTSTARTIELSYEIPSIDSRWILDDDEASMPESPLQRDIVELLEAILRYWVATRGASALVGGNIALRWDKKHPRVGVDPDVYLVEPAPPIGPRDKSIRTWVAGHNAPRVAIEVVSDATAVEDYTVKPEKYAASGTRELWVFDPLRLGPSSRGGPHALQHWKRDRRGFRRVYAGDGPARSDELGAWMVITNEGLRLRVADDRAGGKLWPIETEVLARQVNEATNRVEIERAAKEAALAELETLRAELKRRGG